MKERRGLILAVSGGPDSTALMLLMARWPARPPALVVSVDHGLRPEAADEVRRVAENAAALGLPSRLMRAPARSTGGNLQDWARRARYRLLAEAAHAAAFDTIVTAHHQDDQAETFLLRLARGSGVYGLAAMAEEVTADGTLLARPLLRVTRAELADVADRSGLPLANDPSNRDMRFDRVRMRALMPELAERGLTARRLSDTANRLGRASRALDHYAAALLRDAFPVDRTGVLTGPAKALAEVPQEVALRALALAVKAVGGAEYTLPSETIEPALAAILATAAGGETKRTLGGVVLSVDRGRLHAGREWGRDGVPTQTAAAGATFLWDRRFAVSVPDIAGSLSIGGLARSGRRLQVDRVGRSTVATLPGLYRDADLIAVPEWVSPRDDGAPLGPLAVECVVGQRLGIALQTGGIPP